VLVGAAEGRIDGPLFGALASRSATVTSFVGGTLADTRAVLALADQGVLRNDVELFELERAGEAFAKLAAGELLGRAVVTP
jgi:D-arabinose 1-dehydrogenase-like Zn-dependent alcohol dehydrogenase